VLLPPQVLAACWYVVLVVLWVIVVKEKFDSASVDSSKCCEATSQLLLLFVFGHLMFAPFLVLVEVGNAHSNTICRILPKYFAVCCLPTAGCQRLVGCLAFFSFLNVHVGLQICLGGVCDRCSG